MAPTLHPDPDQHPFNVDFYAVNVVAFVTLNAWLSYLQWKQQTREARRSKEIAGGVRPDSSPARDASYTLLKKKFLPVYLLVFGADWLQVRLPLVCSCRRRD